MFINPATERSLELIASRASDVYKAFTPGATPSHDDVATPSAQRRPVLDPLSIAAPGNDYFVTTDERGRTTYTRDGRLALRDATIVASNGRPMLGYTSDNGTLRPLAVDSVDQALGRVQNLRVQPDGRVMYDRRVIEPRAGTVQMQHVTLGRLALARFPAATRLTPAGDAGFAAPAGTVPHLGRPADGNFGSVVPMQRDESRVDLDRSLEKLHDAYMAFDALQAAHKAQGHTGQVAMDLLK